MIINLKSNVIGHYCPDIVQRGAWCKHVAKILLMVPDECVSQVEVKRDKIRTVTNNKKIEKLIDSAKESKVKIQADTSSDDLSLEDLILIFSSKISTNALDKSTKQMIASRINRELDTDNAFLFVFKILMLEEFVPEKQRKSFYPHLGNIIENKFQELASNFFNKMWSVSVVRKMELAYYFNHISKKYFIKLPLNDLKLIDNIADQELNYFILFLKLLISKNTEFNKTIRRLKIKKKQIDTSQYLRKILLHIEFEGTNVSNMKDWINTQLQYDFLEQSAEDNQIDDYLIYLIKSNREKPEYTFSINKKYRDVCYVPNHVTDGNPATKFVLSKIKESERDYLTDSELTRHRSMFEWFRNKDITSNWIERKRNPLNDSQLGNDTNAMITQWDINATSLFPEFLHLYHDKNRLIPSFGSPIRPELQPFDYTYNYAEMKTPQPWTKEVVPKFILVPRQVVKLVLSGIPIYSNVLPWDVLSKFVKYGFVSSGEVNSAIRLCNLHSFIYGSFELKEELKKIAHIGKSGLTQDFYKKFYDQLKLESGRLNVRSREIARQIIAALGDNFTDVVFSFLSEDELMRVIIRKGKSNSLVEDFVVYLNEEIVDLVFKNDVKVSQLIKILSENTDPVITPLKQQLNLRLAQEMEKLEKLLSYPNISWRRIAKNIFGGILVEKIGANQIGRIDDDLKENLLAEFEVLNSKIVIPNID